MVICINMFSISPETDIGVSSNLIKKPKNLFSISGPVAKQELSKYFWFLKQQSLALSSTEFQVI